MPINRTVVPPNGTPVEHPVPYISGTARAVRYRPVPNTLAVRREPSGTVIPSPTLAVRYRPVTSRTFRSFSNQWACAQPLKCSWFTIQKCFAAFPTRGAEAVTLAIANPLLAA
jgi:hypothetical protein